jgi:hypothetical protein
VLLHVFFPTKQSVDLLSSHKDGLCAAPKQFRVSRLKLSQLVATIRSPCATDKNDDYRFAAVVGQAHHLTVSGRKGEVRRLIARTQSGRARLQHSEG